MLAFFSLICLTTGSALIFLALLASDTPLIGIILFGVLTLLLACAALISFVDLLRGEKR